MNLDHSTYTENSREISCRVKTDVGCGWLWRWSDARALLQWWIPWVMLWSACMLTQFSLLLSLPPWFLSTRRWTSLFYHMLHGMMWTQCGLRNNGSKWPWPKSFKVLSLLLPCVSQEVFTETKANTLARVPLSFLLPWYAITRNPWPGTSPQSGTFLTLEAWAKILFIANNYLRCSVTGTKSTSMGSNNHLLVFFAWCPKSVTLFLPKQNKQNTLNVQEPR